MSISCVTICRLLACCFALAGLAGCETSQPVATSPSAASQAADVASETDNNLTDSMPNGISLDTADQQSRAVADSAAADVAANDALQPETKPAENRTADNAQAAVSPPLEVEGLTRLDPKHEVWLDAKQKRVLMTGQVVRQEGQLEMFACLKNSKEHESIVAVNTKAYIVNAALIALGAQPGGPVQFRPEFKPASGPEVEVTVIYTGADGKRKQVRGQEWIRNIKTGKQLDQPWVFGGSGFWVDESTGQRHFMAEDGDFICISNFNSAMLDLPVESSQASAELMFEAFTERIPAVKTPVVLVLTPKLEAKKEGATEEPKANEKKED